MTDILVCNCHSVEHQIVIQECDGDYHFNIHMNGGSFFTRLRRAFWYVLGRKSKYGDWEEFIINPEDAEKLQSVVNGLHQQASQQ